MADKKPLVTESGGLRELSTADSLYIPSAHGRAGELIGVQAILRFENGNLQFDYTASDILVESGGGNFITSDGETFTVNDTANWRTITTLGSAAPLDVAVSGNASASQVVLGDDTRLTDNRDPTTPTVDSFSGDGSTTDFTLSETVSDKNRTTIHIDGVYQHKATYSITDTTLSFSAAPPAGTSNIEVIMA